MSYHITENAYSRLHQARDAIRLIKHLSQQAEAGAHVDPALLGSCLTLLDEQLSQVVEDAIEAPTRDPEHSLM